MVKLSIEMITKLGPGHNKRRSDETTTHYLNRLTHIYLQEKHIEEIVSQTKKNSMNLEVRFW